MSTYLLWPFSLLYCALVRIRFFAYRRGWLTQTHLSVPVVVVGNVVAGGVGKTPTVIAIVQHLLNEGHHPGVVSRGHGRVPLSQGEASSKTLAVLPDTPAHVSGDEPALILQATGVPVFVGRSRVDAGRALLAAHPGTTVLVCDDGLQHLAIYADVAVAVFDERGVGNGWLLPAGLLREPWPRSLGRRVDIVLHVHTPGSAAKPLPLPEGMPCFKAHKELSGQATALNGQIIELLRLPNEGLTAIAGIAKPQTFFDMLAYRGVSVGNELALADHQNFHEFVDSTLFIQLMRQGLICTEKDAVKLFPLLREIADHETSVFAWSVPLVFTPEPAFFDALNEKLSSKHGHKTP